MMRFDSRVEGIARGRQWLMKTARKDFGYDVRAWHEYLLETDDGGYRWDNGHRGFAKSIERVLADEEWQACVAEAEATNLCQRLIDRDRRQREAFEQADRQWGGKMRACPKCSTEFKSVGNKGHCPNCLHLFYASHPDKARAAWWREIE